MRVLNKEQERALRVIARYDGVESNAEAICGEVKHDCLDSLNSAGYVSWAYSEPEWMPSCGLDEDRVELTLAGRNYFGEKRRRWLDRNCGSLLGILGTLLGIVLGYLISKYG